MRGSTYHNVLANFKNQLKKESASINNEPDNNEEAKESSDISETFELENLMPVEIEEKVPSKSFRVKSLSPHKNDLKTVGRSPLTRYDTSEAFWKFWANEVNDLFQ